eukprot:366163-Chlamydomonas_euryale.AAC.15
MQMRFGISWSVEASNPAFCCLTRTACGPSQELQGGWAGVQGGQGGKNRCGGWAGVQGGQGGKNG